VVQASGSRPALACLRMTQEKIDKYFVKDSPSDAVKVQMPKGLMHFTETFGPTMIAEGIAKVQELKLVRDLGIELGQGYFLGQPQAVAAQTLSAPARAVINSAKIAVLPGLTRVCDAEFRIERLAKRVPPLSDESLRG